MKKKKKVKKKSNRIKPISLHPLEFDEALGALLTVQPPKEPEDKKQPKRKGKKA